MIPDMPRSIELIQNEADVDKAIRHLVKFDMLGYDVETWNYFDRHVPAFDPTEGAKMRLVQFGTPEGDAFVFDLYHVDKRFLYRLFPNPWLLVGQNLYFEFTFLMHELGIYKHGPLWDTMIAEQVLSRGAVAGEGQVLVSLADNAYRHLGVELPKDEQASSWYRSDLTRSQIEYAARDAIIPLAIYEKQRSKMMQQGQMRVAQLEFDCIAPLSWMRNNGIRLDVEQWQQVYASKEKELAAVDDKLWAMLGTQGTLFDGIKSIDLNKRLQVIDAFKRIGIDIPLDKQGKLSIDKKTLATLNDHESVRLYMERGGIRKGLTSYGKKFIEKVNPFTGRIHGSIKQIGADTGRMSGRVPNMMQIPKEDLYRNCFKAREGWVFVDADYSGCELRILAEYCLDDNMLYAFDNDIDLHSYTASQLFGIPLAEVKKGKHRDLAKTLNFGIVYGIGAASFGARSGIDMEEAEKIMATYLNVTYQKLGQWLNSQAARVVGTYAAETMLGRVRQFRGDMKDKKFKGDAQRAAKNMPIQGTNADITKRAIKLVYDEIVDRNMIDDMKIILPVHDELLLECDPTVALECQDLLTTKMLEAEREFLLRVPSKVDSAIMTMWCKEPSEEEVKKAMELVI